jgi:hypothetical protein
VEADLEWRWWMGARPLTKSQWDYIAPGTERLIGLGRGKSRPRERAEHGERSRYCSGCRCGPCRTAERDYQRKRRARDKSQIASKEGAVNVQDP